MSFVPEDWYDFATVSWDVSQLKRIMEQLVIVGLRDAPEDPHLPRFDACKVLGGIVAVPDADSWDDIEQEWRAAQTCVQAHRYDGFKGDKASMYVYFKRHGSGRRKDLNFAPGGGMHPQHSFWLTSWYLRHCLETAGWI
jgi:hypothetical protein